MMFDSPTYQLAVHNRMRNLLAHLPSGSLRNKKLLEFGAGWGKFGELLEAEGSIVTSVEARGEHVDVMRERYPHRQIYQMDLENHDEWKKLGQFDAILAFGLLYHLENPDIFLRKCHETAPVLFLETIVMDQNEVSLTHVEEEGFDQSFRNRGCCPTPLWIEAKLKKAGYQHVRDISTNAANWGGETPSIYDWLPQNNGNFRRNNSNLRRMWIAYVKQTSITDFHSYIWDPANLDDLLSRAEKRCETISNPQVLGPYFTQNNPWTWGANHDDVNTWNGWFALAELLKPRNVLEIGTAFGFSAKAIASGVGTSLQEYISLDLGNFGEIYADDECAVSDNLTYAHKGIELFKKEQDLHFAFLTFKVNTQPPPYTDNDSNPSDAPYWQEHEQAVLHLKQKPFDLILIDGKHTEDGAYNDMANFWPSLRPGGMMICDDLQEAEVMQSFEKFCKEHYADIAAARVWDFLRSHGTYGGGKRIQGLIFRSL